MNPHLFELFLRAGCERVCRRGQVIFVGGATFQAAFPPAAALEVLHGKAREEKLRNIS